MNQYIGYARVSTDSQNLDLPQGTRLKTGCEPFYKEAVSGKSAVRPELERQDIAFESLTEKIETSSTAGKLVFHVFTALAEFEQNLVREWTHASLAAINSRGIKSGRKPALMPQQVHEIKALSRT